MIENLATSDQEIFEDVCDQGIAAGVTTQEAFNELVDEVIEAHREVGELADDQDLIGDEAAIKARWGEYQDRLSEEVR
jgi:hypothetical protein